MTQSVVVFDPPLPPGEPFIDYPQYSILGAVSNAAALRERGFGATVCAGSWALACGAADAVVAAVPPFLKPHVRTDHAAALFSDLRRRCPRALLVAADCSFGGMHYIEYDAEEFLSRYPEVDAVVKYEGEGVLPSLLAAPRDGSRKVVKGSARDFALDDLPFPAWDLIDVAAYFRRLGSPTLPAAASRGCPYRCAFCTSNAGESAPSFRAHGPEYLARCFESLKVRHGAGRLALLDACANADPDRFAELLRVVAALGLACDFPNGLRADTLTLPLLRALKPLCGSLTISAESGDQRLLSRHVRKGLKLEAVERVAAWCRELGLPLSIHYVAGFPADTIESVNRTLLHALKMKRENGAEPLLQNFVPLPGSALHAACRKDGLLAGFDSGDLYRRFQGEPAIATARLSKARLSRMTGHFRRALSSPPVEKLIINLTYRCVNGCWFCAVGDRPKRDGRFERHAALLQDYRRRGVSSLDLDGGEPTLYPRLFELVRLARALGYESVTVTTNGRRLADRAYASRLLLCGITNLLVSLHGPTAEVHESHTRRDGSFAETMLGLRHAARLRPRRLTLAVNTVVTDQNAGLMDEFFTLVRGIGVGKVNVQFLTPFGRAARSFPEDQRRLCAALEPAWKRWRKDLEIEFVNLVPCAAVGWLAARGPELGKRTRDMAFVDAPPQNLADYLDARRERTDDCLSCECACACPGLYRAP